MKTKKILAIALAFLIIFALASCGRTKPPVETGKAKVSIGVLKGPTGIGCAYLMEKNEKGEALNDYSFETAAAPTDITGSLVSGKLDMAALPTNVAASLYAKTNGNVQILALNTLGVLYILENGDSIRSVEDLRGKTIYATGQGLNPEYVLNYILRQNGLEPGIDVTVEYRDSAELTTLMAAGSVDICMLPVPSVTSVLMKNSGVRIALDLTEEWEKAAEGSVLTMGCIVIRKDAGLSDDTVSKFLEEYEESINYVKQNPEEASELVAKFEITGTAEIAAAAIPDCNLIFISGGDIRGAIEGYYHVLLDADASSIGGKLPNDDFYYEK